MSGIEAIEFDDVSTDARPSARLDGVSFEVPAGARCGLLAPEPATLSALGRVLAGLEPVREGSVQLGGADLLEDPRTRVQLGYLPRRPGLDEHATPRELVRYAGRLGKISSSEVERRAHELLLRLDVDHVGGHAVEHLPQGLRRRVALGCALVHDPDVLFAHGPLEGLGVGARQAMRSHLLEAAQGRTLLLASASPATVEELCDRVVLLERGRTVLHESIDALDRSQGIPIRAQVPPDGRQTAVEALREHPAVVATGFDAGEEDSGLEVWITDPDRAGDVLATLVQAGVPVSRFEEQPEGLAAILADHLEGSL